MLRAYLFVKVEPVEVIFVPFEELASGMNNPNLGIIWGIFCGPQRFHCFTFEENLRGS